MWGGAGVGVVKTPFEEMDMTHKYMHCYGLNFRLNQHCRLLLTLWARKFLTQPLYLHLVG